MAGKTVEYSILRTAFETAFVGWEEWRLLVNRAKVAWIPDSNAVVGERCQPASLSPPPHEDHLFSRLATGKFKKNIALYRERVTHTNSPEQTSAVMTLGTRLHPLSVGESSAYAQSVVA